MADSTVYSTAISPGAPPLRWDNVYTAFQQINANFEMIEAALGSAGITPINFNDLDSSVRPAENGVFQLGSLTKSWKHVWISEYNTAAGNELNGLWIGSGQIKGIGNTIDLPPNSTVDGNLIIDPDKTWFQSVEVDGTLNVFATQFNDQLNLISGTGINLNVDSSSESITVNNTGIISASAGLGISVSGTNPLTISNTGVRSITNTASIGTRTPGLGIHTSTSTGTPLLTNTGVLEIVAGSGALIVSTDAVTGVVTITNNSPAQPAFQQVEVDGDSGNRLVADSTAGVLKVVSGYAISLSKSVSTDTLTVAVNPVHDIKGSVFGDDSSLLVDAVGNRVFAGNGFFGNLTGNVLGTLTGNVVGNADTSTVASTVALVATNTTAATHFVTFVDTATGNENVRTDTNLTYNPGTNTLTAGTFATGSLTITGSTIGTTDSSGIIIEELTTFNTDVVFENDISVLQSIFVRGSRVVLLNDFKALVAASSNFADFQARIAAL